MYFCWFKHISPAFANILLGVVKFMEKYRVQTGSLDVTVEAKNHRMAAIKAIDENNPKSLGLIVSVLKEGDSSDEELFMKSEFILECMGFKFSD